MDLRAGCVDQRQGSHAIGVGERHFGGDFPAHRVANQHRVGDAQRIEQRDDEVGVRGVRVAAVGFVREPEAAVVERHHPVACRCERADRVAPRVHRGAEAVNQQDRRSRPRVDVAETSAVHNDRAGPEGRAGRPAGLGR